MRCQHCNHEIPDNSEFCSYCGIRVAPPVARSRTQPNPMDMLEHKSTVPQKKRSDSSLMWKVAIGFVIAVLLLSLLDKY